MLVMAAKRSKSWDQGRRRHVPVHVDHVDRISALPDPIIHQILSLVPTKEAVRTSALSKRWRNLWTSISGLKFLDYSFLGDAINVALNSCLTRHDRNTSLDKFKLDMKYNGGKIRPRMDNWMNIVAKKNVKKLDLTLKPNKNNMVYPLPQAFQYSTSLTTLKLDNLSLETLSSPSLPSLKELILKKMTNLDDQRLQILLLGSPHLEKMRLDICTELSNPRVSSSSLKFLEITLAYKCEYELVQVEASALESFVLNLMGQGSSCDNVKFSSPASIKNLSLTNAKFGYYWLENLISRSPLLQSLTLDNCCLLRKIKIISGSLKRLYLRETKECDVEMGVIHAPNLASFSYQAYSMMNLSIYAPNLLEVNIVITAETSGKSYNLEWYGNLIDFLSNLDCTETLSMHVCSEKAFIMPAELRKTRHSPLPNLKNLKLKTHSPVFRKRMMKDSLSWVTPTLQTLAMQQEYLHWCYFC